MPYNILPTLGGRFISNCIHLQVILAKVKSSGCAHVQIVQHSVTHSIKHELLPRKLIPVHRYQVFVSFSILQ